MRLHRIRVVPFLLHFALLAVAISFLAACGGKAAEEPSTGSPDAATTPDSGTPPSSHADGGMPTGPTGPVTYDGGGGLTLGCAPSPGQPLPDGSTYPGCTFVNEQACTSDGQCACGCSCQCGVCNCLTAAPSYCTTAAECGPACASYSCTNHACVPGGTSPWVGTWRGTPSFTTSFFTGSCSMGVGTMGGQGGGGGGSYTIVVSGQGNDLTFTVSQEGMMPPFCSLPFVVSGNTATLVGGAACPAVGLGNACAGTSAISVDTYISGSAQLNGNTMTFATTDIFAQPSAGTAPGDPCIPMEAGLDQVDVNTTSVTLTRVSGG
jgi:hypothetical protein